MKKELLTRKEIDRHYAGEWVVLVDPNVDNGTRVIGGRLVFHHKRKTRAWGFVRKYRTRLGRDFAVIRGGKIGKGKYFAL